MTFPLGSQDYHRPLTSLQRLRSKLACDRCRERKLKCDDQTPCAPCQARSLECVVTHAKARREGESSKLAILGPTASLVSSDEPANSVVHTTDDGSTMDLEPSMDIATLGYATISDPLRHAAASFAQELLPQLGTQSLQALPPISAWEVELSVDIVPPLESAIPSIEQPDTHILAECSARSYFEPESDLMETFFTQLPEPVSKQALCDHSIDSPGFRKLASQLRQRDLAFVATKRSSRGHASCNWHDERAFSDKVWCSISSRERFTTYVVLCATSTTSVR